MTVGRTGPGRFCAIMETIVIHISGSTPSRHLPTLRRAYDLIVGTLDTLAGWQFRPRDRQQLLSLDDHTLQDIGLNRGAAIETARRPLWHS